MGGIAEVDAQPFLRPWIGAGYAERRARRIAGERCPGGLWHIMGESHYADDPTPDPAFTPAMIERLGIGGYPFFDTLLSLATGRPVADPDRRAGWRRFAFSNFVQHVLPGTDRRPSRADWAAGRRAFAAQLAITRPKQLLIVGKQQWDNLPDEGRQSLAPFEWPRRSGRTHPVALYRYRAGEAADAAIATWIYHPASFGMLDRREAALRVAGLTAIGGALLRGAAAA